MRTRYRIIAVLAVLLVLGPARPSHAETWPCKCDVNHDGLVGLLDLVKVSAAYSASGKLPGGRRLDADVNDDGVVDLFDLVLVGRYFDQTC